MRQFGYLVDPVSGTRKHYVWYEAGTGDYWTRSIHDTTLEQFLVDTYPRGSNYPEWTSALELSRLGNHNRLVTHWGYKFEPLVKEKKGLIKFLEKWEN